MNNVQVHGALRLQRVVVRIPVEDLERADRIAMLINSVVHEPGKRVSRAGVLRTLIHKELEQLEGKDDPAAMLGEVLHVPRGRRPGGSPWALKEGPL